MRSRRPIKLKSPEEIAAWSEKDLGDYLYAARRSPGRHQMYLSVAKHGRAWSESVVRKLLSEYGFPRIQLGLSKTPPLRLMGALSKNEHFPDELWQWLSHWCYLAGRRCQNEEVWQKAAMIGERPLGEKLIADIKAVGSKYWSIDSDDILGKHIIWDPRFYRHPEIITWAQERPTEVPKPLRLMLYEGNNWPATWEVLVGLGQRWRHAYWGAAVITDMPQEFWNNLSVESWLRFFSFLEGGPNEQYLRGPIRTTLQENLWARLTPEALTSLGQAGQARLLAETLQKDARLNIIERLRAKKTDGIVVKPKAKRATRTRR